MAKSTVPVNFKDDIINSAMGGKRRYRVINNSDGTISLEDVTNYDQVGSTFGAAQMNATNTAVNASADASKIIDDLDAIRALTQEGYMAGGLALKQLDNSLTASDNLKFQFATDGEGNYGYLGADDSFIPFKRSGYVKSQTLTGYLAVPPSASSKPFTLTFNELSKIDGYLNDMTFGAGQRPTISSMSVDGNVLTIACTNGSSSSINNLSYTITAFEF